MLILEEVFKNGPDDIQEQMNVIANSFDALLQLQTDVQAQGSWCGGCGRWYYKKDCNTKFFEEEKTTCINPLSGGYLEPYEYEKEIHIETATVCPKGHEIGKRRWAGTRKKK